MKVAVGFAVLILVLLIRPQGIFGVGDRRTDEWRGASSASRSRSRNVDFWINVGVLATTYGVFTLGLQLNVGTPGSSTSARPASWPSARTRWASSSSSPASRSGWRSSAGIGVAVAAGLLVGLPSLRLRADYFAISTLAFSEIVRYVADNWDDLTGGNQGLFGYADAWNEASARIDGWLEHLGIAPHSCFPLLLVNLALFLGLAAFVALLVRSPWGRVLRAIREDEDAARALGKNTFVYKLQSLSIAAALAALAGYMLAINISILTPGELRPGPDRLRLRDRDPRRARELPGRRRRIVLPVVMLEATRYLELPLSDERVAGGALHDRRCRPDGARGLPPAGDLRQAGGDDSSCPRVRRRCSKCARSRSDSQESSRSTARRSTSPRGRSRR